MNTTNRIQGLHSSKWISQRAFTLVEMVAVIAVIATLMVISTPHLIGTIQANRLTSAGEGLTYRLARIQQIVATTGHPAEIRFYRFEQEGVTAYHAYQLFAHDEGASELKALENPVYLKGDNLTLVEGALSPLLEPSAHGTTSGAWPRAAEHEPFKSMNAQYLRIAFYPDGTTSLHTTLRNSYLTIAEEEANQAGAPPPPNYYTLQIDPVTGRAKSYRP
ncbi:MAG TPA: Verru_Chthon cassette protein D [Candidatus Saccharimonadia bacterium]|nr:Verru_Chthon cassette protein D [Candidatus Saccharimonadia bacterium]